jgi:predicted HicB family RNase H-like nuclease
MKKKDHYLKIVEWSEEDQCYIGSIPGWIGKCCHGDNEEDVYRQLCQILDEWIEIYENDKIPLPASISGKKYSGKFQLRVDSDLHKALAIRAMQANESLNSFCGKILRKTILQSGHPKANNCIERD